jgi:hypothetical protein
MHPYREAPAEPAQADRGAPSEDWALGGLLSAVGGGRVAVALAGGEAFTVDATAAGVLATLGVIVLARLAWTARKA